MTLRSRLGEIVEMLELRSLDICCVQETRFRGKSVRMISGKAGENKLFHMGNEKGLGGVGSFLAKRWEDKIIDVSRVSDSMIAIKVLV